MSVVRLEEAEPLNAVVTVDEAGAEKLPKEGVLLFPLVKPPKPLNPPPLPKPGKGVELDGALVVVDDGVKENPLKPLNVPPASVSDPTFRRLAFLIGRFFKTSSLARENVPASSPSSS